MSTTADAVSVTAVETASIRLLGDMQAVASELPAVAPQPGRVAALLALLSLEPGRVVSAERLMDQLWEDNPPQSGVSALYVYISRLRRQLAPLSISVSTRAPGYVLEVGAEAVDVVAFDRAVRAAEEALDEGELEAAHVHLRAARQLWRGDPFQGASPCSDLILEAQRLQRQRDRISELDVRLLLLMGQARAAADLAQTLTERDPLSETHWALRIEAEHDAGNTAVGLALYEEFREILAEELGIDPGARMRTLHTALLRQDVGAAASDEPAAAEQTDGMDGAIGRMAHLGEIEKAVRDASGGRGGVLVLEGPAGVGKTYLAERAVHFAEHSQLSVAWTRGVEGTGTPPLWPWQRILATLPNATDPTGADDLSGLQAGVVDGDAEEAQFRLSEALIGRVLAAARVRPLLLVFDDVQWADAQTLHAVGLLAATVRTVPCLVVLTVRHPVGHRPALAATLASLQRETSTKRLPVAEFTVKEIAAEVQRTSGLPDDAAAEYATRLRERTGGNAFFLTEVLAAGDEKQLPDTVTELVQERLAPLAPELRDLVDVSAVAGLDVDVAVLTDALALTPEQVLAGAEELTRAGLWRAHDTGHSFVHSLARDAVLAALPRTATLTAHQRLASALERRHASDIDPALEAIAYHRYRAAAGMPEERTYLACTAAADRARSSLAFDQAATFRERALTSIPTDDLQLQRRAETLIALTAERRAAGDVVAAASALRQAIRVAQQFGDTTFTVRVLSLLGEVTLWNWRQYGEVDADTISLLEDLLATDSLTGAERADLSAALSMELYYAEEPLRSRAALFAQTALDEATNSAQRSRALSARLFSVWRPDSEADRLAVLDEWLRPVASDGAVPGEVVGRLHRASLHLIRGEIDRWSVDIERAGDLLTRAGRAEYSAQHTAQLAGAALQSGRLDEARALMERTDATMRRTSMWGGAWVSWTQRLTLARIEGRVSEVADGLLAAAAPESQRSLRWAAVLALAEAGRREEARAMQGRWNLRTVPQTRTWSTDFDVAQAAEVAVHLGTPLLTDAYERLAASRSPLLMAGTGIAVLGPRDELLARIAERLGSQRDADAHRQRAWRITKAITAALGTSPSWPLNPPPAKA